MSDDAGTVIVCEQSGFWAQAARRALRQCTARIRETRTTEECDEALRHSPGSLVMLELGAGDALTQLSYLERLGRRFPLARVVIVARREEAILEGVARQAGAIHFVVSPRLLGALADMAVRQAARVPEPAADIAAAIWKKLPWDERDD